jgi:hypothetical protein
MLFFKLKYVQYCTLEICYNLSKDIYLNATHPAVSVSTTPVLCCNCMICLGI